MKKLVIFFIFSFSLNFFAQEGFLSGYIITNKGDTIRGKIKDRKFPNITTSWQKIDFIDTMVGKFRYSPEDLKGYYRKGKNAYFTLTIGIEARKTFCEVLEDGEVILFSNNLGTWGGAGSAITVKTSANGPKEKVEFFLQIKDKPNSLMQWRHGDYNRTAKSFFNDNPELMKSIEDGTLKAEDVREIVKKYNEGKK